MRRQGSLPYGHDALRQGALAYPPKASRTVDGIPSVYFNITRSNDVKPTEGTRPNYSHFILAELAINGLPMVFTDLLYILR